MNTSRLKLALAAIAATAAALMFAMPSAYAVHLENFQVDGDADQATCGRAFLNPSPAPTYLSCPAPDGAGLQHDDWLSLFSCPSSGTLACSSPGIGSNSASSIAPVVTDGEGKSIFTQGGSKDFKDVTQWRWSDGSVPPKDDLYQAFGAIYGDTLYFAANRYAVNGSAQIGFWLLQNATTLCGDPNVPVTNPPCAAGTFVGKDGLPVSHKLGDILVLSNFTNGGGSTNLAVYKVTFINKTSGTLQCPAGSFNSGDTDTSVAGGELCFQLLVSGGKNENGACNIAVGTFGQPGYIPADAVCAATNGATVTAIDTRFAAKVGAAGTYPPVGFFEGGLNLGDLGLSGECFPSFLVETRSSPSIDAILKDFTLGQYQSCDSNLTTEIHYTTPPITNPPTDPDVQNTTIPPGSSIYDKAILTPSVGSQFPPDGDATFTYYASDDCTGTIIQVGGQNSTTVAVSVDANNRGIAIGPSVTVGPGSFSSSVTYTGDTHYPDAPAVCEKLTISKAQPTISTIVSASPVTIGTKIWDTATLSGTYPGATATGTITFTLYPPSDATCASAAIASYEVTVSGIGPFDSRNANPNPPGNTGYTTDTAGTYHWKAHYTGDGNNEAADSACADEPVVVNKKNPSIATTPKVQLIITDVATLSGFAGTPNGTWDFRLWDTADCSGTPVFFALGASFDSGSITTATTFSGTLPSTSEYYTSGKTFKWTVHYNGDASNNPADADPACGETVSISFGP
jgi:hypothetical protein